MMTDTITKAPAAGWRQIHAVADRLVPSLRRAFLQAIENVRADLSLTELAAALERHDVDYLRRAGLWDQLDAELKAALRPVLERGVTQAGQVAIAQFPASIQVQMQFDLTNPLAVAAIDGQVAAIVRDLVNVDAEALLGILRQGFLEGVAPRDMARRMREYIGLTPRYAGAVERLRAGLAEQDVAPGRIEAQATAYAERLRRLRATAIARTETIRAANIGQHQAWRQAEQQQLLDRERTVRRWVVTPDDRLAVVGPLTKVLTRDGWKPISGIAVGDFVLTHKDRFRCVSYVEAKWYAGPTVKLHLGCREVRRVHLTYGHPVLAQRSSEMLWIAAEELRDDDQVFLSAVPCVNCGSVLPSGPRSSAARICHRCHVARHNASPVMRAKQRIAVQKFNAERWQRSGERARQSARAATQQVSPATRAKLSAAAKARGTYPFRDPEVQRKVQQALLGRHPFAQPEARKKAARTRGRNARGGSWLERKVRWFLKVQGIAFEAQWPFSYEWAGKTRVGAADFYLPGPNMVVECDGAWGHAKPEQRLRDQARDVALAALDVRVLHLSEDVILRHFEQAASAIRAACCIVAHPIKRIEHIPGRMHNVVYHLSVEEDESFIAAGVVVHNCPICEAIPDDNPDGVGLDQPFSTANGYLLTPPAHTACRCATVLEIAPP